MEFSFVTTYGDDFHELSVSQFNI